MRNVLITGGGKGLGRSIAKKFSSQGYTVYINYLQDKASANETLQDIIESGGKAEIIQADVGKKEEIKKMFTHLPGIDIFVHNAVYPVSAKAEEIQVDEWEKAIAVNASALLYISQLGFSHMKSTGYGRIYGISSRGSKKGIPRYIGIGSAKAAMESIVRYLATEWGPYGICANTISPGVMDTEAFRSVFPDADKRIEYAKRKAPLGQIVQLEDVAELLLQLSRPEMSMITGQDIIMDGGYSLIT